MGNGFLHILMNEPSPVDWSDYRYCPEQGVCHSDAEPFWLLRTKDGQNELDHPLLPWIPTTPGVKSIFRVVLSAEYSYI